MEINVEKENITDAVEIGCAPSENQNEVEKQREISKMEKLRKCLEKTTAKCLSAGRLSLFARTHPAVAKKKMKLLKSVQKQYTMKLQESIESEMETMLEEENIEKLMEMLDSVIAENTVPGPDPAWRPSGDADRDFRSQTVPYQLKTKERLKRILEQVEEENNQYSKMITSMRDTLKDTERKVITQSQGFNKLEDEIHHRMEGIEEFIEDSVPS